VVRIAGSRRTYMIAAPTAFVVALDLSAIPAEDCELC
jgi:hypothetical protein